MKKIGFSAIVLAIFTFGTFTAMTASGRVLQGNCPAQACISPQYEYNGTCFRYTSPTCPATCQVDRDYTGQLCYRNCVNW